MRDLMKTREYFDVFILEDTKRIEKFQAKIKDGTLKPDRVRPVKDKIIQIKIGIIIAKYSRGDSLECLKDDFESIIDLFVEAWNLESYEDNLRFAALAYLLNVNSNLKEIIRSKLKESQHYDYVIDYVLVGDESHLEKNELSYPDSYSMLINVIEEKNIDILLKYLRGWYNDHYHSSWFDSHKLTKVNTYYGYWSFEAAAISKRLRLEDGDLRNEIYYPYDMAHYAN